MTLLRVEFGFERLDPTRSPLPLTERMLLTCVDVDDLSAGGAM